MKPFLRMGLATVFVLIVTALVVTNHQNIAEVTYDISLIVIGEIIRFWLK